VHFNQLATSFKALAGLFETLEPEAEYREQDNLIKDRSTVIESVPNDQVVDKKVRIQKPNSFVLYIQDRKKEMIASNPEMKSNEIYKVLVEQWKMGTVDKQKYMDMAAKLKQQPGDIQDTSVPIHLDHPKSPLSSSNLPSPINSSIPIVEESSDTIKKELGKVDSLKDQKEAKKKPKKSSKRDSFDVNEGPMSKEQSKEKSSKKIRKDKSPKEKDSEKQVKQSYLDK
jgi:hypothetical protein